MLGAIATASVSARRQAEGCWAAALGLGASGSADVSSVSALLILVRLRPAVALAAGRGCGNGILLRALPATPLAGIKRAASTTMAHCVADQYRHKAICGVRPAR